MLNTKGKPRLVIDPRSGLEVWSPYPLTRAEALAENSAKYAPMVPCAVHGDTIDGKNPVVYTHTGIRGCCAQRNAVTEFNAALKRGEPTDPGQAHAMGLNFYWSPTEHRACGHPGKRLLNGKCFECDAQGASAMSPRQSAIANGDVWYTPVEGDLCPQGHQAPRRVANGSCKECEDARLVKPREPPIYRNPDLKDMVIDRISAKGLGLNAFRTGLPCTNGHTGWRYVSTGNCIECLRGGK